jgi:hypothetical protein
MAVGGWFLWYFQLLQLDSSFVGKSGRAGRWRSGVRTVICITAAPADRVESAATPRVATTRAARSAIILEENESDHDRQRFTCDFFELEPGTWA